MDKQLTNNKKDDVTEDWNIFIKIHLKAFTPHQSMF